MVLVGHNYDSFKVEHREKEREEIAQKAAKMADDVLMREHEREGHPVTLLPAITLLSEGRSVILLTRTLSLFQYCILYCLNSPLSFHFTLIRLVFYNWSPFISLVDCLIAYHCADVTHDNALCKFPPKPV